MYTLTRSHSEIRSGTSRWRLVALAIAMAVAVLWCGCKGGTQHESGPVVSAAIARDLQQLLKATLGAEAAKSPDIRQILQGARSLKQDSPMWPVHAFLLGEVHRLRGEFPQARETYRSLVEWAVNNPYHDGWGASGLASLALWRWLQFANDDPSPNREEADDLREDFDKLNETRLVRRMFETPVLATLPQLQEDTERRLAWLAWTSGNKDLALRRFLRYLAIARTAELTPIETQMMDQVLSSGTTSSDQLTLFRGKRLLSLGNYDEASELLTQVRSSHDPGVRTEACLYLARLKHIRGDRKEGDTPEEVAKLFRSVLEETIDPEIAETALYERALAVRGQGKRGVQQFLRDMRQLVESYPNGRFTADALYELGRQYQYSQCSSDWELALGYFEGVRSFKGLNDRRRLATFSAAISLYTRGRREDLARASDLLQELHNLEPPDDLRPAAAFWLGRMAEEAGDQQRANGYFQDIIKETPYNYYAIRSRMHLSMGNRASKKLWPEPKTEGELHQMFQSSKLDTALNRESPYIQRLAGALETELYSRTVAANVQLRKVIPSRRLEDISLRELDGTGLLPHLGLLLALRQDALAAKDALATKEVLAAKDAVAAQEAVADPKSRLEIAAAVGHQAGDWTLSMSLVVGSGEPFESLAAAQRDEARYLATAYPAIYGDYFRKAGTDWGVPPELLYGVAREESLFYPAAMSPMGALGLFQFIPSTFHKLDRSWNLLKSSGESSSEAYLLNPHLNLELGARELKSILRLQPVGDRSIPLAVMEHNAGPMVGNWVGYWRDLGRADDIEYMIDTARWNETRRFVERVICDMVIVNAAGILKTNQ